MARRLIGDRADVHLSALDDIAWRERLPLGVSLERLRSFIDAHEQRVIEGGYGDLVEAALPACTERRFVTVGVERCVACCRARPWEPGTFESPAAQDGMLDHRDMGSRRRDSAASRLLASIAPASFSPSKPVRHGLLARHRPIFDSFNGPRCEFTSDDWLNDPVAVAERRHSMVCR